MVSNYYAICERNREAYGTAIRRLGDQLLSKLYSDRTHFIYELLQNAEDAKATEVTFEVYQDRLRFSHNGTRKFTEADVIGICSVLESTKADDLSQIGKFGLGFKAVYAYTDSPSVYSGDERFRIRDYVYPEVIEPIELAEDETQFEFPFKKENPNAHIEIGRALGNLGTRVLLFLKSIKEVSYKTYLGEVRSISRQDELLTVAKRIHLSSENSNEQFLLFESSDSLSPDRPLHTQVAIKIKVSQQHELQFVPVSDSPLFVYFQTEKRTGLKFLTNAPFQTTPARDNIRHDSAVNKQLIGLIAQTLIMALRSLRDAGELAPELFDLLPMDAAEFVHDTEFLLPLHNTLTEALKSEPLFLTDKGYVRADQAVITDMPELPKLLSDEQLAQLTGDTRTWLSPRFSEHVRKHLKRNTAVKTISFSELFKLAFLQAQSDDWMLEFYRLIARKSKRVTWGRDNFELHQDAIRSPFLRLTDNTHVPLGTKERPNAYLPSEWDSAYFPSVKSVFVEDEEVKQFFKNLGLRTPSIEDYVRRVIISKYTNADRPTDEVWHKDLDLLLKYGQNIVDLIKNIPILQGINCDTGKLNWVKPSQVYAASPELQSYFADNPDAYLLAQEHYRYDDIVNLFSISLEPRLEARNSSGYGYVPLKSERGNHSRGLNSFDPDAGMDGLKCALINITVEKSQYIWNVLLPRCRHLISGDVEEASRQDYSFSHKTTCYSSIGLLLISHAWLPDQSGQFHKPSELDLKDLPEGFQPNRELARQLQMKASQLELRYSLEEQHAKELGITLEEYLTLKNNPDEVKKLVQRLSPPAETQVESSASGFTSTYETANSHDYPTTFLRRFNRPSMQQKPASPPEMVTRRFRKSAVLANYKDIVARMEHRSSLFPMSGYTLAASIFEQESFTKRQVTALVGQIFRVNLRKNPNTRIFLENQYEGRCQVCSHSFRKRENGRPYFQAIYIVAHRYMPEDDPGNVLCLCANHAAQFLHGSVEVNEDIIHRLLTLEGEKAVEIVLCGKLVELRYSFKHIELLRNLLRE
jgi:hypothetical protein